MPIQKTEAIVLRRTEFRETSLIATFYTPSFGKIRGIVKGIRSKENRHDGTLDLGSVNLIVFYEKPKSELYLVSQVELKKGWYGLSCRLERILFAQVILEEMDLLIPLQEPNSGLYQLLFRSLQKLSEWPLSSSHSQEQEEKILRYFEAQMIQHFGVFPRLERCVSCQKEKSAEGWISFSKGGWLCEGCHSQEIFAQPICAESVAVLGHLKVGELEMLNRLTFSERVYDELANVLTGLIEHHVEKPIRSVRMSEMILREIGNRRWGRPKRGHP